MPLISTILLRDQTEPFPEGLCHEISRGGDLWLLREFQTLRKTVGSWWFLDNAIVIDARILNEGLKYKDEFVTKLISLGTWRFWVVP
jgi:UDP-3-O-acyl-N-acetylglucosamine deacetylase